MSVNIVNKTTGELTKVAGNVAPPTDSVTNGDMRPVTSNAVYDAMNDSISIAPTSGETWRSLLSRLYNLIDLNKITYHSILILRTHYDSAISEPDSELPYFLTTIKPDVLKFTRGTTHFASNQSRIDGASLDVSATVPLRKSLRFLTTATTMSTGNAITATVYDESTDNVVNTSSALYDLILYY